MMKFQILFFALFLAFSPFMQAQSAPSVAEEEAVGKYFKKYMELANNIELLALEFNDNLSSNKEIIAARKKTEKDIAKKINKTVKEFTDLPVPPACKEIRVNMIAYINCRKIMANKTVNNIYSKQAEKELNCKGCDGAILRAFQLKSIDPETQTAAIVSLLDLQINDFNKRYNMDILLYVWLRNNLIVYIASHSYAVELMFIYRQVANAQKNVLVAMQQLSEGKVSLSDFATSINAYQATYKEHSQLFAQIANNFEGDNRLWKAVKEFMDYNNNYSQELWPKLLSLLQKNTRTESEQKELNNLAIELSKVDNTMSNVLQADKDFAKSRSAMLELK